jgi:hypothetical protein
VKWKEKRRGTIKIRIRGNGNGGKPRRATKRKWNLKPKKQKTREQSGIWGNMGGMIKRNTETRYCETRRRETEKRSKRETRILENMESRWGVIRNQESRNLETKIENTKWKERAIQNARNASDTRNWERKPRNRDTRKHGGRIKQNQESRNLENTKWKGRVIENARNASGHGKLREETVEPRRGWDKAKSRNQETENAKWKGMARSHQEKQTKANPSRNEKPREESEKRKQARNHDRG